MAISNPSFETLENLGTFDQPGVPDDWALTMGAASSWEFAQLTSVIIIGEDFESGWLANEGRRTVFGTGERDNAAIDVGTPEAFEDFEEEWSSNEDRRTEFGGGERDDASIDAGTPETFEDFEEEWSSNENRRTVFGGGELDSASIDAGAPEAFEDFEEEWDSNENRRTVFGGGERDDATIAQGAGTGTSELFATAGEAVTVPGGVAVGAPLSIDTSQPYLVSFAGTLTGQLEVRVQRDGFATWETIDTITAVGDTVDLSAGYKAIRIARTVIGGVTTCAIRWPILTEL